MKWQIYKAGNDWCAWRPGIGMDYALEFDSWQAAMDHVAYCTSPEFGKY